MLNTTTKKSTKTVKTTTNSNLIQLASLWYSTSKNNITYLSGQLADQFGNVKVRAYLSDEDENRPYIRVFNLNDDGSRNECIITLWKHISKKGNEYLSGLTDDKERIVAFYNLTKKNPKEPDIRIYLNTEEGR